MSSVQVAVQTKDDRAQRESSFALSLLLLIGMVVFYASGLGFIPYTSTSPDGIEAVYRVTTLHVFVIYGAMHVRWVSSLLLGAAMGCLSCWYALDSGILSLGDLKPFVLCNIFLPRVAIGPVSRLVFLQVQRWKNAWLAFTLVGLAGTMANSLLFSACVLVRWWMVGLTEYEESIFGSEPIMPWLVVVRDHIAMEVCAVVAFLMLLLHGMRCDTWQRAMSKRRQSSFSSEDLNGNNGDTTMNGLFRVTDPRPSAVADVVFVHGLDGDARSTWHPSGQPDRFWPMWVADQFADAEVWTLGYAVSSSAWRGTSMPLVDRATNTLDLFDLAL